MSKFFIKYACVLVKYGSEYEEGLDESGYVAAEAFTCLDFLVDEDSQPQDGFCLAVSDNAKSRTCKSAREFSSRHPRCSNTLRQTGSGKFTRELMKTWDQVQLNEAIPHDTVQQSESLSYTYMKLNIRFAPAEYLEY